MLLLQYMVLYGYVLSILSCVTFFAASSAFITTAQVTQLTSLHLLHGALVTYLGTHVLQCCCLYVQHLSPIGTSAQDVHLTFQCDASCVSAASVLYAC